ncbi:T9SS type A sorting domain-containing protein [Chryseobacterium taeanense]|uniref:T9SS type A sorting domain-containing protein n=1 Tax=Chryseobacterium taeanense TaxID=311334 RepID=UPI0035AFFC0B
MQKITFFKVVFLLSLFCSLGINAQIENEMPKKTTLSTKKGELEKSHGFERCSSNEYEEYLKNKFPERMTKEQFEAWLAPLVEKTKSNKSQNGNIITIPVVVHVIHSGQNVGSYPNITDAQVLSQITVLNNDYRKAFGTTGYNTNPVGADVEIQFAMAKVDPNGNPTNGVDRVNLCRSGWTQAAIDDYVKPETIWDTTKYLNMWTVAFEGTDQSTLGYAQFPSNSGLGGLNVSGGLASTDGVVAAAGAFGSSTYNDGTFLLYQGYDKGRTMTHEVGHWLGLRHIWGDSSSCVVDATDSNNDYCLDTPAAAAENYNCVTIDSCPSDPGNDMVENYMDYTPDACMNIFTLNQKARIRTVMDNSPRRVELKTSIAEQAITLFPLDAEIKVERGCNNLAACPTSSATPTLKLTIYNRGTLTLTSATVSYSVNGGAAQTYNWTGSLAQDKFSTFSVPVAPSTPSGNVTASIVNANGGTDQRTTNNTATGTFINPVLDTSFNTTTVNFNLQLDYYGTETTWTLKNSNGTLLYSGGPYTDSMTPALISQTWTLNNNDCYIFKINDSEGDGLSTEYPPLGLVPGSYELRTSTNQLICTGGLFGDSESRAFSLSSLLSTTEVTKDKFAIYPNPANDVLNITKVSSKAKFEIYNAVGQLVKAGNIDNNQVRVSELIKGTYIITIKDNNISESIKFIKK